MRNGGVGKRNTERMGRRDKKFSKRKITQASINGKIDHQIGGAGMKRNLDKFFNHIESITGREGEFFAIEKNPSIIVASYPDVPQEGSLTAFSFGLSEAENKEWRFSRPELMISMDSSDVAWALAMGEVIRNGWGRCLFKFGQIIDFGQGISKESSMSAFLVFSSASLEASDVRVELNGWAVNISQLYPIHSQEVGLINKIGAERFFNECDIDFFNPARPPFMLA